MQRRLKMPKRNPAKRGGPVEDKSPYAKIREHVGRPELGLDENGRKFSITNQYENHYPGQALELLKVGASMHELALHFGVTYQTVTNWGDQFPEFRAALNAGLDAGRGYFEKLNRETLCLVEERDGPQTKFADKRYIHTMAVRYKVYDRQTEERDLSAITVEQALEKLRQSLGEEELSALKELESYKKKRLDSDD